jgi:hypothetical protein
MSGYHSNATGKAYGMLQPHGIYLSPGASPADRRLAYREHFRRALDPARVHDVRTTVQTGTPLGNDHVGKNRATPAMCCWPSTSRHTRKCRQRVPPPFFSVDFTFRHKCDSSELTIKLSTAYPAGWPAEIHALAFYRVLVSRWTSQSNFSRCSLLPFGTWPRLSDCWWRSSNAYK